MEKPLVIYVDLRSFYIKNNIFKSRENTVTMTDGVIAYSIKNEVCTGSLLSDIQI